MLELCIINILQYVTKYYLGVAIFGYIRDCSRKIYTKMYTYFCEYFSSHISERTIYLGRVLLKNELDILRPVHFSREFNSFRVKQTWTYVQVSELHEYAVMLLACDQAAAIVWSSAFCHLREKRISWLHGNEICSTVFYSAKKSALKLY